MLQLYIPVACYIAVNSGVFVRDLIKNLLRFFPLYQSLTPFGYHL